MNHSPSSFRFGLLAAFVATLAACAAGDTVARDVPVNTCQTDTDCVRGSCDAQAHLCVAPEGTTEAAFAVTPPTTASVAAGQPITFAETPVSNGRDHVLVLSNPRHVVGSVEVADAQGVVTTIPASVQFRRVGALSTAGPVTAQSVRDATQSTLVPMYGYDVRLEPGMYDVTVTPADISATPPYLAAGVQIADGDTDQVLSFRYPDRTEVSGVLLDATTHNPVTDVTVRIVDPAHPGVPVSTVRPTDAYGAFSVWLAPGAPEQWALQISSVASDANRVGTGRLVYQIARQAAGAVSRYSNLSILLPTMLGFARDASGACANCVAVSGSLEGTNPSGMLQAVGNATIDLRADNVLGDLPPGHTAWFEAQVLSVNEAAADGSYVASFAARLLPGTYAMTITPPASSSYAVTRSSLVVSGPAPQRGRVFEVRRLVPVTGTLIDGVRGLSMSGIEIDALPVGAILPDSELVDATDRLARAAQGVTGESGHFSLSLDPGSYRIVVRPPAGLGYATHVDSRVVSVVWSSATDNDPVPLPQSADTVYLEPPILLGGSVRDGSNLPVADAVVRAFARLTNSTTGLYLDVDLGQVSADANGAYQLLLPSRVIQ